MAKATANASNETEEWVDPKTQTYIVKERKDDGSFSETLVVGLAAYKKKWKIDHLDDDDFYHMALDPNVMRFTDRGVRVASEADLEKFGDQQKIAALVQEHTF